MRLELSTHVSKLSRSCAYKIWVNRCYKELRPTVYFNNKEMFMIVTLFTGQYINDTQMDYLIYELFTSEYRKMHIIFFHRLSLGCSLTFVQGNKIDIVEKRFTFAMIVPWMQTAIMYDGYLFSEVKRSVTLFSHINLILLPWLII